MGGGYPAVENYIRSGDYDAAQRELDDIQDRDGKWHYYQSIIFYKREWLSESRAQLVLAVQMEPENAKYRESLRKLDLVMGNAAWIRGIWAGRSTDLTTTADTRPTTTARRSRRLRATRA